VRTICKECKEERALTVDEVQSVKEILPELDSQARVFYIGKGCVVCDQTGYRGRIGIRETLEPNDEIRQLIMNRASAQQIKEAAVRNGMKTMAKDGVQKALNGVTSLEEILRIVHE
jgi:type IV pilus assembly protein PilB